MTGDIQSADFGFMKIIEYLVQFYSISKSVSVLPEIRFPFGTPKVPRDDITDLNIV